MFMSRLPLLLGAALAIAGCAAGTPVTKDDESPSAAAAAPAGQSSAGAGGDEAMGSGGGGQPDHDPEIVRTGKSFKLDYGAALARYAKGASCAGGSSPESVLGAPDQRNEMQMGKVKLVTYGFRYKEGTLLIRCRGDHVEIAKTLK